ncbi:MAG TPA: cell envelope integrity protein CreD [Saprospiraceae bacterium]|nr:cell envelope integrity protein CreD [Saprospiraceae bacterium]HMP25957.1 cell envelope integrity protein CreD [Saprospiraceae bacterium]
MQNQETSNFQKFSQWLRQSLFVKLAAIGFLILLLMIPQSMIQSLVHERQHRQREVVQEVSSAWGAPQTIIGPVLSIPYTRWTEPDGKRIRVQEVAHFLPVRLEIEGQAPHQIRQRGIFSVILYQAELSLEGIFARPDFASLHIDPADVQWEQAKLSVGISGMTGIKSSIEVDWNDSRHRLEPGTAYPDILPAGVSIGIPIAPNTEGYTFRIPVKVNGSDFLQFEAVGKETTLRLQSDWPSPGFSGSFLPDQRAVSEQGFSAVWQVLDLNRNYPQSWKNNQYRLGDTAFGVRFVQPVDEYAKNSRSAKYAVLVIVLTFLIYFFFETLRRFHVHPFQYLLVGLAISVFYLLLLSLSEHIGFNYAYLCSTIATVGLIVFYSASVLKIRRLVIQLALLLIAIYSFIFIILQLEDYALLAGSLGLFMALAAVMYYSRRVDWYNPGASS